MTDKDDWNGAMKDLIRSYNDPPNVPREEMWATISGALKGQGAPSGTEGTAGVISIRDRRRHRWLVPSLAAAAILLLGVAVGRWTASPTGTPEMAVSGSAAEAPTSGMPFRLAAADYLFQTEAMLTLFKVDARSGGVDPEMREWARGLLLQTRVLMETRQGREPGVQALLEDLELTLMQISGLPGDGDPRLESEVQWIGEDLEVQAILPRVQAVMPQSPVFAGT